MADFMSERYMRHCGRHMFAIIKQRHNSRIEGFHAASIMLQYVIICFVYCAAILYIPHFFHIRLRHFLNPPSRLNLGCPFQNLDK